MNDVTKKCPMCAETIKIMAETCEYCGSKFKITSSGYCTTCHTMQDANESGHCRVCGTEVADLHVESKLIEEAAGKPAPVPPARKNLTWLWVTLGIVGCFVIAGIIGGVIWALNGSELPADISPLTQPTATVTPEPTSAVTPTNSPIPEPVQIRWFVGLGAGSNPDQITVEKEVVSEFNATHPNIELILEVVPNDSARGVLAAEIAAGNGPDIVGPAGWGLMNRFYGQWLDLAPYIQAANYDTSAFSPALVASNHTEEGQVALPFMVHPAVVYYQKGMFDEAGLNYPPATYGEPYTWPDGTTEEWNYDTLAKVARKLTIDARGRDATQSDFNRDRIVQFGYNPQWQSPGETASYWGAGKLYEGEPGDYTAAIPDQWKAAWRWYYNGMWGAQPFIPGEERWGAEFGEGNNFNSGKIAMTISHSWYLCCLGDAGKNWDLAALPAYNGAVHGIVHVDFFRIWKGTQYPTEAFEVLAYLIDEASPTLFQAYNGTGGGMPARATDQIAFFNKKVQQFPWVTNWDVMKAGLGYLDIPSSEGYMPNIDEAMNRIQEFGDLMINNGNLNLEAEITKLQSDLQVIFNK